MISIDLPTGEKFHYTPGNASAPYEFLSSEKTDNTLSKKVRDFLSNLLKTSSDNNMGLVRRAEITSMVENGGEYITDKGSSGRQNILNTRMHIGYRIMII